MKKFWPYLIIGGLAYYLLAKKGGGMSGMGKQKPRIIPPGPTFLEEGEVDTRKYEYVQLRDGRAGWLPKCQPQYQYGQDGALYRAVRYPSNGACHFVYEGYGDTGDTGGGD